MGVIVTVDKLKILNTPVIVLTHGVYDILCLSHLKHLEWAKSKGDILVVSLTADEFVNKGKDRPHFTAEHRAEQLCHLICVDYVVINRFWNAVPIIRALMPSFYVKGSDTQKKPGEDFEAELHELRCCGGKLLYSPAKYEHHTTDMDNLVGPESTAGCI